jgi:Icc protein
MSTPSSCIQFAPGSECFKADDQPPGYRWLDLYSDGRIETAVSRVTGVTFEVDLDSSGYL